MSNERQEFLIALHALQEQGISDETIDLLGRSFAEYEGELVNLTRFLLDALGQVTVADTLEAAHEIATATLSEVLR